MRFATHDETQIPLTVRRLAAGQPDIIEVTTPTPNDTSLKIEHGLGRVPQGYTVIKQPYGIMFQHGTDPNNPWTDKHLYILFSWPGVTLTLAVY